ncbi:MAG: SLC45 family MFS transporter [Synechococcales cyanobacterium]
MVTMPGSNRWVPVGVLAALQGAVTLCWVIYNFYLPDLLQQVGVGAAVAIGIQLVENALAAVVEPLMGGASDRLRQWVGSRFPLIAAGVVGAVALFALIPWLNQAVILCTVVVLWAVAMSVFRSPALAQIHRYVNDYAQPRAVALLTLVGGVVGGFAPVTQSWLVQQGPAVAFTVGSLVLLLVGIILRWVDGPTVTPAEAPTRDPVSWPVLLPLLGLGFGVGVAFRMMLMRVPDLVAPSLPVPDPSWVVAAILLISGAVALPAGQVVQRLGTQGAVRLGLVGMAAGMALCALFPPAGAVWVVLLGTGFSLVSTGAISHALALSSAPWAGLAVGLYFGGFSAAMAVINAVLAWTEMASVFLIPIGMAGSLLGFLSVRRSQPPAQ